MKKVNNKGDVNENTLLVRLCNVAVVFALDT